MASHAYTPSQPRPPVTVITRRAIGAATALLALSGTAAAAAETSRRREVLSEPTSPDAVLIALCTEVGVLRDRFNHESALDSDECPIWAAYTRAADVISKAQPQTLAGLVAKARAAKLEATTMRGHEDPAGTPAEEWAWDLVNDLIRIGGRA